MKTITTNKCLLGFFCSPFPSLVIWFRCFSSPDGRIELSLFFERKRTTLEIVPSASREYITRSILKGYKESQGDPIMHGLKYLSITTYIFYKKFKVFSKWKLTGIVLPDLKRQQKNYRSQYRFPKFN